MNKKHYNLINFDHLMKIYEFNYQLIHKIFSFNFRSNKLSTFVTGKQILQYEPITISKYTSIFRLYYKFANNTPYPSEYYIKPHLIFTLYNDAKLLEAKTLKQSREFDDCLGEKIKTNIDIFLWLNLFHKKSLNINSLY